MASKVQYPLEVLNNNLHGIECLLEKYEDLAAVCAKWLVQGVYIQYYGPLFQQRNMEAANYREKRNQLRMAIEVLQ
jgi:hypothetical protein